jgi:thioredoxin-related protein
VEYERRKSVTRMAALGVIVALATGRAMAVPLAKDLHRDGYQAEAACKPLLLAFSDSSCRYCHLLETEVLNPTMLNRDYDGRVLMRKLLLDSPGRLKDFDGNGELSARQLARRYKVELTPTLLFVNARGEELAERLVGVTTLELYGGYLDSSLDASRDRLRKQQHCGE